MVSFIFFWPVPAVVAALFYAGIGYAAVHGVFRQGKNVTDLEQQRSAGGLRVRRRTGTARMTFAVYVCNFSSYF